MAGGITGAALAWSMLAAGPALAQTQPSSPEMARAWCFNKVIAAQRIGGCTYVLGMKKLSSKQRAGNRPIQHRCLGMRLKTSLASTRFVGCEMEPSASRQCRR